MLEHPNEKAIIQFLKENLAQVENDQVVSHLESCLICQEIAANLSGGILSNCGCSNQDEHSTQFESSVSRQVGVEISSGLDDSPPQIPHNRFLIIGELARGGMGVVYRGFDRALKRQVAIKVPRQNHRHLNTYRLCREADIASQIQHPGVVPIYDRGQLADGRPYLVMQLIEGKNLLELIRTSGSSQPELLRIFGDIVRTMAYAHSLNYVHRDLKPQNVMVGKFGEVQIIDWGLAKRLDQGKEERRADGLDDGQPNQQSSAGGARAADESRCDDYVCSPSPTSAGEIAFGETQFGAVMGSRGYMSPEQVQGRAVNKRGDVFAIGGILFQILTGDAPCAVQTAQEECTLSIAGRKLTEFKLNRPLIELDGLNCDPEVIELCKACLSEDPFRRPQDAQAVKARLGHDFYLRMLSIKPSKSSF